MRCLDLFSGIGGFSLGLERAGMETVAFCEYDKHAQRVLRKHWPDVPIFEDVRTLDGKQFKGAVDVVCGGFPCQDLSVAGKKAGFEGERSSLYREMLRIISECLPRYAIFENVTGLLTGESGRWFGKFLYDLAEIGFDAEWHCIPASELGAHHHRDRVWIIAYPNNERLQRAARERSTEAERKPVRHSSKSNREAKGKNVADSTSKFESIGINGGEPKRSLKASPERTERFSGRSGKPLHIPDSDSERGRSGYASREDAEDAWKPPIGSRINTGRVEVWDVEPSVGRVANGVPGRVQRLKQLGNAVCPPLVEAIGRAIMEIENGT